MKIIKRHIKVPLHQNRMIVLVNSVNGAVISLSSKEKEIFLACESNGITPELEQALSSKVCN